jgi:hypothetical protein
LADSSKAENYKMEIAAEWGEMVTAS